MLHSISITFISIQFYLLFDDTFALSGHELTHLSIYIYINISPSPDSVSLSLQPAYGIERDIRTSLATLTAPFSHTNPIGCTMSILRLRRWWEGVMPFRRRWLDLTRSFGTILWRGRMATVYPAGVVGRHLLSVVLGADVHHGCCR